MKTQLWALSHKLNAETVRYSRYKLLVVITNNTQKSKQINKCNMKLEVLTGVLKMH
jgi:hypothetical protein